MSLVTTIQWTIVILSCALATIGGVYFLSLPWRKRFTSFDPPETSLRWLLGYFSFVFQFAVGCTAVVVILWWAFHGVIW
jgi:hypothetical protein